MKKIVYATSVSFLILIAVSCNQSSDEFRTITPEVLKDKIAGGWAGKMVGVTYGAPTEFRAQGRTYEDSIKWKPADIRGSMWQDDIYVQLDIPHGDGSNTASMLPSKKYQEIVRQSRIPVCGTPTCRPEKTITTASSPRSPVTPEYQSPCR